MQTFSGGRAAVILSLIATVLLALLGRVAYLQSYGRQETIVRAERQQYQTAPLAGRRGTITDRNGLVLAGSVQTQTVYIDPKFTIQQHQTDGRSLVDLDNSVEHLAGLLSLDPYEISRIISERFEDRFVKLAQNVDQKIADAVLELQIPGVGTLAESARNYPMGAIASHVLGGVGTGGVGLEGLELRYNKLLTGQPGFIRVLKDARRRAIAVNADDYVPPTHGRHLVLTIDANLQLIVEQELAAACEQFKAPRGEAVLMDPRTGEVLAIANYPTFNPQNLQDSPVENRLNRAIVVPYEPGSTFKPFIAGPALGIGLTRINEVFPIHGPTWFTPYRRRITDVHPYAELSFWDVLVKSSNIGSCMIAERMGAGRIFAALKGFGFGHATGIELPGEDPGIVHPLAKWTKLSIDSLAQGYEVMVTPLQLARAFSAYANGGSLVNPTIIKGTLEPDGTIAPPAVAANAEPLMALEPATALQMRRIFCDVMIRGTARGARSHTWNLFGKTGTAHISQGKGGYAADRYTSSFMGGGPYEDPRLVVVLAVHEPDKQFALKQGLMYYGGSVAAPSAARILERGLAYLQVPPSPDLGLPPEEVRSTLYAFDPKLYKRKTPEQLAEEAAAAAAKAAGESAASASVLEH